MPRIATFDRPATEIIRVRVTPDQRRALEHVAVENRSTVTGVIRDAVNDYVAQYRDNQAVFAFRGTKSAELA